ncbi:MAG: methyltransferase domain-containing protein, partial [Vicinamibacterales bacterium]
MAYSPTFFASIDAPRSAQAVLGVLGEYVQPSAVIDVGCGTGSWLRGFHEAGCEVLGVDGPWVQPDQLQIPTTAFRSTDLTRPLQLDRRFDLALSLEVGEHLPEGAAQTLVQSLTAAAPVVLFSAAIPHQGGEQHVNEQWPAYWARLFAAEGYGAYDVIRLRVWDDPAVEWWYAQNAVVYALPASASPALAPCRVEVPRPLVHPRAYLELHAGLQRQIVPGKVRHALKTMRSRKTRN